MAIERRRAIIVTANYTALRDDFNPNGQKTLIKSFLMNTLRLNFNLLYDMRDTLPAKSLLLKTAA